MTAGADPGYTGRMPPTPPKGPVPAKSSAARKALVAHDGSDEFSVFSTSEMGRSAPIVNLKDEARTGRPDDTAASNSLVRFLRKIFGD